MDREQFKAKREKLGYTQAELGGLLGLHLMTISRYETGRDDALKIPKVVELALTTIKPKVCEKVTVKSDKG